MRVTFIIINLNVMSDAGTADTIPASLSDAFRTLSVELEPESGEVELSEGAPLATVLAKRVRMIGSQTVGQYLSMLDEIRSERVTEVCR